MASLGEELTKFAFKAVVRGVVTCISDQAAKFQARKESEKLLEVGNSKLETICVHCETALGQEPQICHKCGSNEFTTLFEHNQRLSLEEADKERALEAQRQFKQEEKARLRADKQRKQEHDNRMNELLDFKVCSHCDFFYATEYNFCPTCTAQTIEMPEESMMALLAQEFPDLYPAAQA